MLGVLAEMAELAREKRRPAGRVDHPAAAHRAFFARRRLRLTIARSPPVEFAARDTLAGFQTSQPAAPPARADARRVSRGPPGKSAAAPDIARRFPRNRRKAGPGRLAEPQPQPLLRQLFMTEIIRQAEDPGQETTAHLGRRFADFAIEFGRFLDDQNARRGTPPLDQQSAVAAPEKAPPTIATSNSGFIAGG